MTPTLYIFSVIVDENSSLIFLYHHSREPSAQQQEETSEANFCVGANLFAKLCALHEFERNLYGGINRFYNVAERRRKRGKHKTTPIGFLLKSGVTELA